MRKFWFVLVLVVLACGGESGGIVEPPSVPKGPTAAASFALKANYLFSRNQAVTVRMDTLLRDVQDRNGNATTADSIWVNINGQNVRATESVSIPAGDELFISLAATEMTDTMTVVMTMADTTWNVVMRCIGFKGEKSQPNLVGIDSLRYEQRGGTATYPITETVVSGSPPYADTTTVRIADGAYSETLFWPDHISVDTTVVAEFSFAGQEPSILLTAVTNPDTLTKTESGGYAGRLVRGHPYCMHANFEEVYIEVTPAS